MKFILSIAWITIKLVSGFIVILIVVNYCGLESSPISMPWGPYSHPRLILLSVSMTLSHPQAKMPLIMHPESGSCTHLSVLPTKLPLVTSPLCSSLSQLSSYSVLLHSFPSNLSSLTFLVWTVKTFV